MEKLKGKVAIVTGAGSGIGKALARRLAADGASGVIADIAKYDVAAAEIAKATGARTLGLQADVSNETDVERMAAETVKAFGRIDILVNNAAVFSTLKLRPFEEIGVAEWRKVMDVNILGVALCCRACVPHMRKAGGGRIINLASGAPIKGVPLFLHYISSKGAVIAMTRGMARELGPDGINVNAIAPGLTEVEATEYVPAERHKQYLEGRATKRAQQPDDVCGAVLFLLSDDAAFMTGQVLPVNGGFVMN